YASVISTVAVIQNLFHLYHIIFETKTVRVGENINLTCTRRDVGTLFWIKLVSGNFPKILGRSFSFQGDDQRIRTGTEPGTFVLHITKAQQSDAGCAQSLHISTFFFFSLFCFYFSAPEPAFSAAPPSDPVHLEHKVTLQCSVLHDFQNKTCPTDDRVFCLSTKSNKSHPKYTHMNAGDDYENNSKELSTKKCVYSYFRNFSTSDFQRYYCIVAKCVESEDKVKGNTEALNTNISKKETIFLYLLSAALAISLIAVASLIYSINKLKKKSYVDCNGKSLTLAVLFLQLQLLCKLISFQVVIREINRQMRTRWFILHQLLKKCVTQGQEIQNTSRRRAYTLVSRLLHWINIYYCHECKCIFSLFVINVLYCLDTFDINYFLYV
uniref:Immunoglobulin subtype domain-containing protein n=1 Tax=Amphilophus citrinellus TaxID=61819 RepID=A0A3Q0QZP0_AMPCI